MDLNIPSIPDEYIMPVNNFPDNKSGVKINSKLV